MPIRGPDQMGLRDGGREQRRESCDTGGRGSIIVLSLGKTKRNTKGIASKEGTSSSSRAARKCSEQTEI